jgi:ABC-type multidrug transport system ATPase subunit
MEEADALSDKVAIMAFGSVVCVGDTLYLKNTYGNGYSLSLTISENDFETVNKLVLSKVPSAKLISSNSGSLLFNIPGDANIKDAIIPALTAIENAEMIRDWGISQTTLEEVYLTVTKKHKFGYGKDQVSV